MLELQVGCDPPHLELTGLLAVSAARAAAPNETVRHRLRWEATEVGAKLGAPARGAADKGAKRTEPHHKSLYKTAMFDEKGR